MKIQNPQPAAFKPPLGLAEQIADYVQKQIVSEQLAPGERIPEAQITRELDVSRGPVREALQVLSRRHLVDLLPRKGARVSEFGPGDVEALYDLQEVLINLLVRRVSDKWNAADLDKFRHLQSALIEAAEQGEPFELLELSFEFQLTACEIAGNSYLTALFVDLHPSFSRAYFRALAAGQDEIRGLEQFVGHLITNIAAGEVNECERLVHDMSQRQRQVVLATFSR
ncbi:MAG: GntR family transcriptional regulator [Gammaproteobacteria bacterium]|nr:GntR family transcriptional regulator [Gammaproteobacteria bacterium]